MVIRLVFLMALLSMGFSQFLPGVNEALSLLLELAIQSRNCSEIKVEESNIKYLLYTPNNKQDPMLLSVDNLYLLDPLLKVKFIIHGWNDYGTNLWVNNMKDAYLQNQSVNIIAVDWSVYAKTTLDIGAVVCAVPLVGEIIGNFIYNLEQHNGISLNSIVVNGFSLGGQVSGYVGQAVQALTGGRKIGQINALDAAAPGFQGKPANQRVDKDDAIFVQAIHTSNGLFGYAESYGTVDFYVSCDIFTCGSNQAGCPLFLGTPPQNLLEVFAPIFMCSHSRAAAYFTESISSQNFMGFPQTGCPGIVTGKVGTIMGKHCPTIASGNRYLSVNPLPQFAKGASGTCNSVLG